MSELSELELEDRGEGHSQQLPPVDGGKDAWLFLAASFVIEALVWGKFPVALCLSILINCVQAFLSHSVFSKTIIRPMSHSPAAEI